MGLLIEGRWVDQWYDTRSTGGKFVRADSSFRNHIGEASFPAEPDRYHLYVSYACPWAHRAIIFRRLKGLEELIPMTVVGYHMGENGWELNFEGDPLNGMAYLYQVYTLADPSYSGRVTVPVLWDKKQRSIVNNESAEIIRMFNSAFNELTGNSADYYPLELREEIDSINSVIYEAINNGVYKAGFATSQGVYEQEVKRIFAALDELEDRLSRQRYLAGGRLTEADWRLFTTLIRFDAVYVGHFKCNLRRIADYPNLSNYLRELYQQEGIAETVHLDHIKGHYYTSHDSINPNGIVPWGPLLDLNDPHDRDRL